MRALDELSTTLRFAIADLIALRTKYPRRSEPHEISFAFLYERIDEYAIQVGAQVLIIADDIQGEDGHRADVAGIQRNLRSTPTLEIEPHGCRLVT